jgi:hypothetical protein
MPQTAAINTRIAQSSNAPVTGNSSKNYTAATTGDQTKATAGVLLGFDLNAVVASGTLTAYDGTSTSGKKLGAWSLATLFTGGFFSTGGPNGLAFATGLFVVIVNAGGGDVTVVYR